MGLNLEHLPRARSYPQTGNRSTYAIDSGVKRFVDNLWRFGLKPRVFDHRHHRRLRDSIGGWSRGRKKSRSSLMQILMPMAPTVRTTPARLTWRMIRVQKRSPTAEWEFGMAKLSALRTGSKTLWPLKTASQRFFLAASSSLKRLTTSAANRRIPQSGTSTLRLSPMSLSLLLSSRKLKESSAAALLG